MAPLRVALSNGLVAAVRAMEKLSVIQLTEGEAAADVRNARLRASE